MRLQVRCPHISLTGERCGALLLEIGPNNTGPLYPKCRRCKLVIEQMSSEAGRALR